MTLINAMKNILPATQGLWACVAIISFNQSVNGPVHLLVLYWLANEEKVAE